MRLKLAFGRKRLWLQFPEDGKIDVARVLQAVKEKYPEIFDRWCDAEGRLRSSLSFFVNGEHIRYKKGMETVLRDGDEVYVIPLMAGG
jgi:molybdopterin converting factor small subunit